jgi:hypothetical protein
LRTPQSGTFAVRILTRLLVLPALPLSLAAQGNAPPCADPVYRAFDYWIGEWEVHDTTGALLGHQSITRIGNCGISEHWQPVGRGTGRSLTWYSSTDSTWNQLYLGGNGWLPRYRGRVNAEGEIEMSESVDEVPAGTPITKMRYYKTADGLRQVLWQSNDRGQTWTLGFVGIYTARR